MRPKVARNGPTPPLFGRLNPRSVLSVGNNPNGCSNMVQLVILPRDTNVEHTTEEWLYDISNFIGDVGGYIGLLLGASMVSVYSMLMDLLKALARKLSNGPEKGSQRELRFNKK